MDAGREDQRHLRGHAADQPADRGPAHPRLLVEGALVAGALDLPALLARVPDYREFLTLEELAASSRRLADEFPGLVELEAVGTSAEGRPIELLTIGRGRRPALLLGVPHPNEPIGTLTLEFLCRLLCEDDGLRERLDLRLHVIKVADPDGLVLNEGWLKGTFSPLRYALNYYRPPHHEQVEWSFPVAYKTLRFDRPAPETAAVMRVMERVRPRFLYSLHNAGFCGVYFYVSRPSPDLLAALPTLVAGQGLALHRGEPEVPYLRTHAPAVYALFGVDETYDYLAATLGEDPAPLIAAGTSSDDWLTRLVPDAFSLVCELPYYTADALADDAPAGWTRRDAVLAGAARAADVHAECARHFAALAAPPDHRLTRSVVDYLRKTPTRLAAERQHAARPEFAREATRAEALDAGTCRVFYHLLPLGEVHRLAVMTGAAAEADRIRARLATLMADVEQESQLRVLPLRPLVAVQAGAGLLALTSS